MLDFQSFPSQSLSPPPFPLLVASSSQVQIDAVDSPFSLDSNVDVTAYANEMVQQMERAHTETVLEVVESTETDPEMGFSLNNTAVKSTSAPLRTSTPTFFDEIKEAPASLSQIESAFSVLLLKLVYPNFSKTTNVPQPQFEDDITSSVYEFLSLPVDDPKVHLLTDLSESEKTVEESSQVGCPILYGSILFESESGTEACDESDLETRVTKHDRLSSSTSKRPDDQLPELLGRSRAILKTYFDEATSFNLPQGHPTVVFKEPQINHLSRVMSNETLKMSHSTMERMVVDAVKGKPTTASSRTGHFQTRP